MYRMNRISQSISSAINLGAPVLVSSFVQHYKYIQYVLLTVAVVTVLLGHIGDRHPDRTSHKTIGGF